MSRRRSRQSFDRRLDALEGFRSEYPPIALATFIAAESAGECDDVAGEPRLIRCYGDVYRVPRAIHDVFAEMAEVADS
jgi:hypothetical protein